MLGTSWTAMMLKWPPVWRRLWRTPLVVLHLLLGVLIALCLLHPPRRAWVSPQPAGFWCRGLAILLGLRIHCQGEAQPGPVLLVANHISWLDIIAISAICPVQFLAKQEVAHWPLMGWLSRRAGTLFIQRGAGAANAIEQLSWRLRGGQRMLVFPEGTSTPGHTVQRFHPRLFQAAIHSRCPVQPLCVQYPHPQGVHPLAPFVGNDALLPHLWRILGEAEIPVTLMFLPPISSSGQCRNHLASLSHGHIVDALFGVSETCADPA